MLFFDRLTRTFTAWQADQAPRLAASLAYYAIFSLAPLLFVAVGVGGIVLQDTQIQAQLITQASQVLGIQGALFLNQLLQNSHEQRSNLIAIIFGSSITLFGALNIFNQLSATLDTIWRVPKAAHNSRFWLSRYVSSTSLLLGSCALLLSDVGISILFHWQPVTVIASICLSFTLFAFILRSASSRRPAWRYVWPAALLTTLLFSVGKSLLTLYLTHSSLSSSYGAAGSLFVILLWLSYSIQIFLFGAEYLQVLEQPVIRMSFIQQLLILAHAPFSKWLRRRIS